MVEHIYILVTASCRTPSKQKKQNKVPLELEGIGLHGIAGLDTSQTTVLELFILLILTRESESNLVGIKGARLSV